MTQPIEVQKHVFTANGVITDFAYTFTIVNITAMKVYVDNVLESDTNYVVNTISNMIEFDVAPVNNAIVTLIRETDRDQTADLPSDPFEDAIDHMQRQIQDLQEESDRSIKMRRQDTEVLELPALSANKFIKVNATSDGVALSNSDLDDLDSELAAATASAAAALVSETNAAASEGNAATSETNAGNSASAAATAETNAETAETNAETAESNAAASAALFPSISGGDAGKMVLVNPGETAYIHGDDIQITKYREKTVALSAGSGSVDVDVDDGVYHTGTITGAITLSFISTVGFLSGFAYSFTLVVEDANTNITWPGSVDWGALGEPILNASGVSVLIFHTDDQGTVWHGYLGKTA